MEVKRQQEHVPQTDFYTILQVDRHATLEEIKKKYNELILLYHPDKGGDSEQFKNLQIAYKVLSNDQTRHLYTQALSSTYQEIADAYHDPETGRVHAMAY